MNREPLISIIIATFNRSHLIEKSLTSVQHQTYKDWECIIVDDGSTDGTRETIKPFLLTDRRYNYIKRSSFYKKGLSGCRNMGLDMASGKYVIFFDDDDLVHPQNLEVSLDYLEKSGNNFCNYQKRPFFEQEPKMTLIENRSNYEDFGREKIEEFVNGNRAMASCTVLWDKKCFENIRFNEDLHYAEEWECYGRILLAGFEGVNIGEVLYFNRKHPGSNTGRYDSGNTREKDSMVRAASLMIEHLSKADHLTPKLEKYFLRLAFKLNSYGLLQRLFRYTQPDTMEKLKYWSGFQLYPLIRPIFKIKAKL